MVKLGRGQAIIGGMEFAVDTETYSIPRFSIHHMTISNGNGLISLLNRKLSIPYGRFLAIPIPDTQSGCITESNIF